MQYDVYINNGFCHNILTEVVWKFTDDFLMD